MKTAILYARVAQVQVHELDKAQEQFKQMDDFCKKRNIEVVGRYCDVGSGATFERGMFQEVLELLKSGKLKADVILVTRWDRFSRNLTGALEMIKTLRALGVKVKSLQDFDSNDFEIILKHSLTKKK